MSIRTRFGAAIAAVALSATLSLGAQAQTELKFGHVGEPGSLFAVSAEKFAEIANAKLGDKAKVVVFGSSQLGGDTEMMQKLKLGTIQFSLPSSVMSSIAPEFGLFEMPYLVKDRDHMKRIEAKIFWDKLAPLAEAKGYKLLAVWENGFRNITNNKKPINTPADLAGIKLRIPKGVWRQKMFVTYGANPTPMALSEVFVGLQTGVVDGQENPLAQIAASKFQEVQKYLSMTGHVYTPAFVAMGLNTYNSLDPAVQKALTDAAREAQAHVYDAAAAFDRDLIKVMTDAGMTVNEVDKPAFVAASKPVYDAFSAEVSGAKELIDAALALAQGS